ncbi:helix-turn-helix domain-containing protein [Streptomyces sp. NPDC012825]|uniref:helix-turn-helix domain-containing protein n=1 Tax=Streptomyces sp. NPDC012825 TaxID=3364851 RepID=UPI0036BEC1C4
MEATETTEVGPGEVELAVGEYVRASTIAEYFDIGLSTVYQAIEQGDLPAIGVGNGSKKALRVRLSDVLAYEKSRRIKPKNAPTL